MTRYLDPTNDVAFKKLFRDKTRLIDLLNNLLKLPAGSKIIELDYIPTEQMPLHVDGRRSLFDLKVQDETGRWYIVEMQRKMEKGYLNRAQYYGCYTYINQLEEGIRHKDLLPVVVISIIGTKVFSRDIPYISYHHIKESTTHKQYLFSLTYVFVELGKFNADMIKDDADQWLHLLKCATKEQEPPQAISNKCVLSAYEDLEQYRWSAEEHDAYTRSRLAQEAEEDTLEAKYTEGKADKAQEIAKNLLMQGVDIDIIEEATGLSKEEITKLRDKV